jgi:hypothetical protein
MYLLYVCAYICMYLYMRSMYVYYVMYVFSVCTYVKVKIKVTLEQATKAQRGSRGIALHFP